LTKPACHLQELVAKIEGEPGLARARLAGPHLNRDVATAREPASKILELGLAPDQIDRLRVGAQQADVAAFLAPPREHGEAERGRAGDRDPIVLADDLDGDVALAIDLGALLSGGGFLHPSKSRHPKPVRFHHNAIFDARGFHHRAPSLMARSDASHLAHVAHII
jgi:hypothetical protein